MMVLIQLMGVSAMTEQVMVEMVTVEAATNICCVTDAERTL